MSDAAMDWDVLIIGRSYAGLSAALILGRARRSVLIVGSGGPRNEAVHHIHGMLTRDGASPGEIIAAAEHDLVKYESVQLVDDRVMSLQRIDGGFRAMVGPRPTTATKVILATGVNDNPPPIAGLAEYWGRDVFTCPFCDGFEHQDTPLVVVGEAWAAPHLSQILTGWTDDVTLFAQHEPVEAESHLTTVGVRVDDRAVSRVVGDGERVTSVQLDDGSSIGVGAVFVAAMPKPNNQLAIGLGCDVDDFGFVVVDTLRRATVDGVWAIGDLNSMRAQMSIAIADGVIAAADCVSTLLSS